MSLEPLKNLWRLAFGDSEAFIDCFFSTAYAPERCQSITLEGRLAAALYWLDASFQGQKFAYLYAVATHPDFRSRGLCRDLMADTHAHLAQLGYDGTLLMPAEAGLRQMYRKMGYQDCCTVSEFSCTAAEPLPLRSIGLAEYARLRREFLPENSAVQEGVSLAFLASYARFYAGADFLLAAAPEDSTLRGIELLGNRDAAPGILAALGYPQGTFRTPGEELPFAMFRPLTDEAQAPGYLGLVFD